ncbi:MAG: M4 family metallopeptidase [Saprospiraceae bacterium]
MKSCFLLAGWVLLLSLPFLAFGQKAQLSKAQIAKNYTFYQNTDPSLDHRNYFEAMRGQMLLSAGSDLVLTEETADPTGYLHFRYQQFQSGVPVFGCRYTLHEKDGKIVTATGRYSPQVMTDLRPVINATTAVAFARRAMQAKEYAARPIEPKLCLIDPAFPEYSETLRLAYQVDLLAIEPYDKRRYFVDATSGQIIRQFPLLLPEGVPGKAHTHYYGVQNITTDSIAPQEFVLRDPTRGGGIFIYNEETGDPFTNTSSTWDLTNANGDEVALDVHYCTQEYYDMMLADYNWQGQDGQGKALRANVHGGDFANAFWNGESSSFGDGDCNYGPLTTLEVVGHEFTHGMIDYSSQLVYNGESGAINESLADMFGKMLERKADAANFSWDLGHSFLLGPEVKPFRVMDDPKSVQMPAYYQGEFWEDGNDVHYNSSIGNLWFSMLVDGRQGVNEQGAAFNVPALGIGKTGQIVFQVNKNYFTESSDYHAFYEYSFAVAQALYGAGSVEAQAVEEAWKAVGLTGGPAGSVFDLGFSDNSFEINHYCGLGQYLPVKFQIKNTGTVAYTPSMQGTVILSDFGLADHTVYLTSPIAPGEVFDVEVNNWLQATSSGFITVYAELSLTDDNPENNNWFVYYNVKEQLADDLTLYAEVSAPKCFAAKQEAGMYVTNNSCETVPGGTVLNFTATDDSGNLIWTSPPYALTEDLPGFGSVYTTFEVPLVSGYLNFNLIYANDSDQSNNQATSYGQVYLPITANYLNDFETNFGQDGYLEISGGFEPTILYQNSHYFAASGQTLEPQEAQPCVNPLDVFDYPYVQGINASIHTCLDFSFSPAPVLQFDLAQFRNATTDTSNYLYSSMLQAKWRGNATGKETIFGQPEGVVTHHNILLPPFFKGDLDFTLYTLLGHSQLDPFFFGEDDFVLLDNLQLNAPTSGTEELSAANAVLLSPNPAGKTVRVRAAGAIKAIGLQNANGETLQRWQGQTTVHDLDLDGLANGFYLLNIQLENGQSTVKKLVKMD